MEERKPSRELKKKPAKLEKQKGNRAIVILLAITVGISLVFYLKNVQWRGVDVKVDFSFLKSIGGSRTVTFE